jgi:hypothetical protein
MKKIVKTSYQCEICKEIFLTEKYAIECEKHPVTYDRGVKKGDKVNLLTGKGNGELATVERTYVINQSWGHGDAERYWHTIGLIASLDEKAGSRILTFDDYEVVK